jgi:hypothetical protein
VDDTETFEDAVTAAGLPGKAQLTRQLRRALPLHFYDESGLPAEGVAIYTLADPRDIRAIRYVGQSRVPNRRYLQHLNTARLWLPDATPWWIPQPRLRPLYDWIRALYREERRLPVMIVSSWVAQPAAARTAERARIHECLQQRHALLNVESELLGRQLALL